MDEFEFVCTIKFPKYLSQYIIQAKYKVNYTNSLAVEFEKEFLLIILPSVILYQIKRRLEIQTNSLIE